MNLAFAGFRHDHIFGLYQLAQKTDNVKIVAAWEENDSAIQNAKQKEDVVFTHENYEDILSDNLVDAVGVGNYYGARGGMIIKALKAGKHVITDKPICTTADELQEIRKLAQDTGLKIGCMLDLRYMPQAKPAKEIIKSGKLGEIHTVSFSGQHCLDYGNRPNWYFEKGKHGGTINDIAIHGVDLVRYLTGFETCKPVAARTWNAFATEKPHFKDCAQFMAELDNNVGLMGDVSYAAPSFKGGMLPTYWCFYFWGTNGMMTFCLARNDVSIFYNDANEESIICGESPTSNYLIDFMMDVAGTPAELNTQSVLSSTEATLAIQKAADNNN